MQIEEQAQPIATPENLPQTDSTESKNKRGGRRPGAGRKPNLAKRLLSGVKPLTAAEALEGVDVRAIVHDLLKNGSRPVKLQTLTVLWDRIYGRPKQEMNVSGGMVHTHTRDLRLAALSTEALEELARTYDEVVAKHTLPALDVTPDGPHNQIESNTAIEEVEVVSEGGETVPETCNSSSSLEPTAKKEES
jgi:hypothetical protein